MMGTEDKYGSGYARGLPVEAWLSAIGKLLLDLTGGL